MKDDQQARAVRLLSAVLLFVLLGVLAAALSGASGTLTESADRTEGVEAKTDRTVFIGGGSLGDAQRNPIGTGVNDRPNPFQQLDPSVQFTVETPRPDYWRVNAYTAYENGTWVRTGEQRAYSSEIPPAGPTTTQLTHQVTLTRGAVTLPAVWQPAQLQVQNTTDTAITLGPERGLRVDAPVPLKSNYTAESHCYAPSRDALRSADASYPVSIEEEYTQLPETVPDQVITLAAEITAGSSDRPYQLAENITEWLGDNKKYDIETTHPPGTDPVEQFLFEMDGGTSEYFASAAVLMLRSQGVPARYVTGYSPGEKVPGEDRYRVRGLNAHTWAEVYVPTHGWTRIDPTPTEQRIQTETNAVVTDGQFTDAPITASCQPNRDTGLNDVTLRLETTTVGVNETADAVVRAEFANGSVTNVTNRAVVISSDTATATVENGTVTGRSPGETTIAVRFSDGTTALTDTTAVEVTGESRTDTVESVSLSLPTDQIEIGETIEPMLIVTDTDGDTTIVTDRAAFESAAPEVASVDETVVTGESPGVTVLSGTITVDGKARSDAIELTVRQDEPSGNENESDDESGNENESDDDPGKFDITVEPTSPEPGDMVTVTVSQETEPVAGITVLFNGEPVGTTNNSGQVQAQVPFSESIDVTAVAPEQDTAETARLPGPGPLTSLASPAVLPDGGSASPGVIQQTGNGTNSTVTVAVRANLTIAVSPAPLVTGGSHTVVVRINGRPLPDAEVRLASKSAVTTNDNGTATVRVPSTLDGEAAVLRASRGTLTTEQRVSVGQLRLTPTSKQVLALPGQAVTVTATVGGAPVSGIEITQDGTVTGTTDSKGEANVSVSGTPSTAVGTVYAGQEVTTTIQNQLLVASVAAGITTLGLIGVAVTLGRRYSIPAPVQRRGQQMKRFFVQLLFRAAGWIRARGRSVSSNGRSVPRVRAAVRAGLAAADRFVRAARDVSITAVPVAAWQQLRSIGRSVRERFRTWRQSVDNTPASAAERPAQETSQASPSIQAIWQTFVRLVAGGPAPTKTPGEIARRAKAIGLPARLVEQLTNRFRAAVYGPPDTADETTEAASTLDQLKSALTKRETDTEPLSADAGEQKNE